MPILQQLVIPGLATVFVLASIAFVVMLMAESGKQQKLQAELLTRVLASPESFSRIWFVQTTCNTEPRIMLYARDKEGAVAQLASPRDAANAWSMLQQAGVVVHASA